MLQNSCYKVKSFISNEERTFRNHKSIMMIKLSQVKNIFSVKSLNKPKTSR